MFNTGFPPEWSTLKKLVWLVGSGIAGAAAGVWKTVSGSLIHITDALASPMQKCEVTLEPIQDLHGQDAPYPAGGGKQLIDDSLRFITGNTLVIGAESFTEYSYYLESGTTYRLTVFRTTTANMYAYYQIAGSSENLIIINKSSANTPTSTFVPSVSGNYKFWLYAGSGGVVDGSITHVMLTKGSETVSEYAPYSNICPITGWTGCEVNRTGVNLWDEEWEIGGITNGVNSYSNIRLRSKNYIPCKGGATYFGVFDNVYTGGSWYVVWCYDKDKTYIGDVTPDKNKAFTTLENASFFRFSTSDGWNGAEYTGGISFNYPSTDTDYHAYSGTTLSVTFPSASMGKFEVVSGDLKPFKEYNPYNGETLVGEWMSDRDKYVAGTTPTIGAQVVDLGAFDTSVSLTPTPVDTLQGENNIWADAGDVEITYKAQA